MKALYGEPDDVWYDTNVGVDDQTAWYFYRNNWNDMIIVGAVQPFDEKLYDEFGMFQSDMPIESDTCVIAGIYTNKIDFNLSTAPTITRDIHVEYAVDKKGEATKEVLNTGMLGNLIDIDSKGNISAKTITF